jgi:hypothetical protein
MLALPTNTAPALRRRWITVHHKAGKIGQEREAQVVRTPGTDMSLMANGIPCRGERILRTRKRLVCGGGLLLRRIWRHGNIGMDPLFHGCQACEHRLS